MGLSLHFQRRVWSILVLLLPVFNFSYEQGCGEPPDVPEAEPNLQGRRPPFVVGTNITYSCFLGFNLRGGNIAYCVMKDGTAQWLPLNMNCDPVMCGDPGYVMNGRQLSHIYTFGNNVTYVCNPGFELANERGPTGKESYTLWCLPNGNWDKPAPQCVAIKCPSLENPENGVVRYKEQTYRAKAQYTCNEGFSLNGPDERICQEDRKWSGPDPSCTEITCPEPVLPRGRIYDISQNNYKVGSLIIYSCNEGGEQKTVKCQENGSWNRSPPVCPGGSSSSSSSSSTITSSPTVSSSSVVPTPTAATTNQTNDNIANVQCGDPGEISNGFHNGGNSFPVDQLVTYQCKAGYSLRGNAKLKCLPSGLWDISKLPICVEPVPVATIIGVVIGCLFLFGCLITGGVFLFRWFKRKHCNPGTQSYHGGNRKANPTDAGNVDEIQHLGSEKSVNYPVTAL
ncbi:P-selectin-like isoform X1 [Tachypleus tridentatus]|uniref:P-selectin-like isoform X1 n=1 Tax=Tachypleus tridentatus TaxID=6853 RepID=UPI003FD1A60A